MTRKLNDVMYVDSANDTIPVEIEEVRSSVSYTLNNQVYNLTLNAPEVCRLGFNPTETIEIAEKRVA